jgi:alpha-ketoglutarate-dependent taurine dioxygenase
MALEGIAIGGGAMSVLGVRRLSATVGGEVVGLDAHQLVSDASIAAAISEALEVNGVLVFRGLNLDPESQVAFGCQLGEVDFEEGYHPVKGISRITLDRVKRPTAEYLRGTFVWHIDGCTPLGDEYPQKSTILSAQAVADSGGQTEFASTHAAYQDLGKEDQHRLEGLRVVHSFEASMRLVISDPTSEQVTNWRRRPTHVNPLVWTHSSGRRSLVIGSSADHVVGMETMESRMLLDDLLEHTTRPDRVYRHHWSVGDTVIWDNRGVVHRALPYGDTSRREMLRTTVLGDEPML